MARKYEKKSPYWSQFEQPQPQVQTPQAAAASVAAPQFKGVPMPEIHYGATEIAYASAVNGGAPASMTRDAVVNSPYPDPSAYANLRALPSPYSGGPGARDSYTGCSEAVLLCAKAWTGISICRNAVEVPVEFSNQPLYVKCQNETVRKFFEEWFKAIQIHKLKEQFFREYYRSGNVFLYRFDGQFGPSYYGNFQRAFGARNNRVPIRYEILSPANVFVPAGVSFPYTYVRLLSTWECERLRNPVTEQDRQVLQNLPREARDQILNGQSNPQGIYMPLDPKRLRWAFYKTQSYEPMAVPMLWPVLADIEAKLVLRKMDMRLARTIEHAILLVTNGEAPSKENGGNGINQKNIARLQKMLSGQAIGRVLVADYTTKAEWLIPDIQEILGPEKYQVINEDIKEGLQSILSGADKFANAQIKAKVFIQRLEEGQGTFLNDFLMPEVRQVCEDMGFRHVPEIGFRKIDLEDKTVMARIVTQLGQLGILTAEQVIEAIGTGVLPDAHEMQTGQEAYKKARDKKLYQPLIGGGKEDEGGGPNGRPAGSGVKQSGTRKSSPIGTSKASEGALEDAFSTVEMGLVLKETQAVAAEVEKTLRKRHKLKGALTEQQQGIVDKLVTKVVATQPRDKWVLSVASVVAAPPVIPAEVASEIEDIRLRYSEPGHELDDFDAAVMRHCRTAAPDA